MGAKGRSRPASRPGRGGPGPALAAAVLALAGLGQAALAAPRRVIVVNLASDQEAGGHAAATVRAALDADGGLATLPTGDLQRALEEPLAVGSPDAPLVAEARDALTAAQDALDHFQSKKSHAVLARAEAALLAASPTPEVAGLLADVSFAIGLVDLREQNRGLAVAAFQLGRRLDPARKPLDPARYAPEVIEADQQASKGLTAGQATVAISATFDGVPIVVDGRAAGQTPLEIHLSAGLHYVVADPAEYERSGQRIDLSDGDRLELKLELKARSAAEQARALRRAALGAADGALAATAREATALATVDAAVIIADRDGEPAAAIYERSPDRLSSFRPVGHASGLLGLLVPAELPEHDIQFPAPGAGPAGRTPWYLQPWVVAPASGGLVVLTVVGILSLGGDAGTAPRSGQLGGFPH